MKQSSMKIFLDDRNHPPPPPLPSKTPLDVVAEIRIMCTINMKITFISGPAERCEFQAETRQLLDIVAKSLYSEKEVYL